MPDYNRLLQNFEDVRNPKKCIIKGSLPSWLHGTMLRNGPGAFKFGETEYNHWFDGPAYIQRYYFEDGKMWYSAKFLDSESYRAIKAADRIVRSGFGTAAFPDPCKSIFSRFFSFFFNPEPVSDNDNVAFSVVGDGVYALTETPKMTKIDMDTLDSLETVDMSQYLTLHTFTAHCHQDEEGNIYNIGSHFDRISHYIFAITMNPKNNPTSLSTSSVEETRLIGRIPASDSSHPGYYHSFGMSQNYFVLFEAPVRINIAKLIVRRFMRYSYHDALGWDSSRGTNVIIVNKHDGKPLKHRITADPFFTFHHANTFEKDGCLVVDYCKMNNPGNFDQLLLAHMRDGSFTENPDMIPRLHRMIIPLEIPASAKPGDNLISNWKFGAAILKEDGSVHVSDYELCEEPFEFPRYNYERNNMKEYKYVYGSSILTNDEENRAGIVKANVVDLTYNIWQKDDPSQIAAEPIFVPHPDAVGEDDGILLVPVMTTRDGDSPFVVVLDATDLSEIARCLIPEPRIPLGFHAMFQARNL